MALDPLRFAIEIADEASTKITNIKTLIDGLNNKEITVNVQGNLKEVLDILSKSGTDANALSGLQNALSGALSALEGLGNAAKNGDLGTFSTEVGKATEAVNGLATAFEKMNVAVGNNESFKSFMTGVGELVSRTNSAMKQLNSVGGNDGGNDSADKGFLRLSTSVEKARYELYQFDNLIKNAESASRLGKQFSDVDTNGLDKAIEKAKTFRAELEQISRTGKGKDDRRFDKFALQADYKEAVAEVRRLVGETETLETSQRRYNTILQGTKDLMQRISNAQDSAQNIGAQNKLIGKFSEAYYFKQRLQSLSDSDKANAHIISELAAEYTRLAQALTRATKEQEKLNAATEKEKKRSDDDRAREIQRVATNQRRLNGAYEEAGRLIARLEAAGMKGLSLNLDVAKIDEARNQLVKFQEDLVQFGKAYAHNNHTTQETIGNFNILRRALVETAKAQEQMNTATEKANKEAQRAAQRQQEQAAKQAAEATKRAQQENEAWANSMKTATNEANKLDVKIRELQRTESGAAAGVNTSQLRSYINDLRVYRDILKDIAAGSRVWGQAGTIIGNNKPLNGIDTLNNTKRLADEAANAVNRETREIERNQAEKQKAAGSTSQLTAEEQRLAQALNQTTEHARGQSQVLSDLKSMAMQYLGVWGGQQFLRNIIEIGGQLEMQRLSIGAILQNQSQANELFEKIKGLAVQSPFGVVELDQMTKQLTAYGFKYNELFDITKRLADISAATGTGVDRLALALGHVRSEAALSGYTLRQFSMANVPLLQKLSEKLGKTTQEIRKMVRAKEVSYEDVIGVLQDITNEGGMFYNMQEVISQSVKAKFKNVKDAMDIMYGEMAEGYIGDSLKGVADALMEVTRNWKDAATVLGTGAALWAAQRVAVMAYTSMLGKNNAAILSSIATFRQQEVMVLRQASLYRTLSLAEKEVILTSQKRTSIARAMLALHIPMTDAMKTRIALANKQRVSDIAAAFASKKLKVEDLARQVALGRVTKEEAKSIISKNMMAGATRNAALATIDGTKVLGFWGKAALTASGAAISLSRAVMSIFPQAALMAGVTALVELWQRNNREMENAKEIGQSLFQMTQDALKSTRQMMQETGIQARTISLLNPKTGDDTTNSFGLQTTPSWMTNLVIPEFDPSTAQGIINQWTQYIRNYAATPNKILNESLNESDTQARILEEQYKRLGNAVTELAKAYLLLDEIGVDEVFQTAIEHTNGGWLDDDVVKDIKDYSDKVKKFNSEIAKAWEKSGSAVKKGINAARIADDNFAKKTEGVKGYGQMLKILVENYEQYSKAVTAFESQDNDNSYLIDDLVNARGDMRGARTEMENELKEYYAGIRATLDSLGITDKELAANDRLKQGLLMSFKKFLSDSGIFDKQTIKKLMDDFSKEFGIGMDDAAEKTIKRLSDWQQRAQKFFEVNKTIKVKTTTVTDMEEFVKAVREDLEKKKAYVKDMDAHIHKVFNIDIGVKFTTESIGKMIAKLSEQIMKMPQGELKNKLWSQLFDELMPFYDAMRAMEEDQKWLKSEGFLEKDPSKDKSKNKNTGSKEDKNAKAVRERVRILKEAADAFEYWNKKLGPTGAWERVNEQFGDVLSKIGVTIDNIEDLRGHLKAVTNSKEYKAIKDQKVKLEIDKEIAKDLDQLNRKVFEKSIDEYKSKVTKMLDDLTRRWETYNTVRQATGSRAIALDLAGISEQDRDLRNAADAMKRKLVDEMRDAGGDSLVTAIPLDVYVDEEKLRDQFKAALGDNEEQAKKIDGLVEAYKRWQKAQQNVTKADIDAYAKIIGSVVDYASRIDRINGKLEQEKENIEALVALYNKSGGKEGISQDAADAANAILTANANFDKLKEGSDYINLMNRSLSMTKGEVTAAASAIEDSLNERLAVGAIKAEEYATEMKRLHDIVAKFDENSLFGSNSALTSFLSGGLKGSQSFVNDRIVSLTIKSNQEGLSEDEQNELDVLIELRKKLDSAISKLSGFAVALQVVTGALDGFHKAAQSLSEMFDALGKEGPASFWGDIADGISAVSSIFAPANNLVQNALSGNIGGVLSSAISAPVDMVTGPITAFAKLHDKRLERAIERLREDVKSIEANTELIVRSRERTLGYDMGDVRRQMAQQYATTSFNGGGIAALIAAALGGSQQNKSMYDYYMQNSQGTGYEQEYANLVEQREKYMEILKDQQDKKKKSNEEIEETKSKIAELDDQIRYFSQDLAKELWGIDIKGWADQLSDALASAFENGENMAKAYRDTVTSILQQMMQKMMQMQILEPMFANLQKDLFGENGKGGVFDPNNPKGSLSKVTKIIGDYFGKGGEGEKAITASMEFMTAFQRGMQSAGLTVLNEASNTLSSGIQGTSEETSGLLAGYVNALRQDVSVNRILLTQYVTQLWPQYIEAYTAQVTSVSSIDNNVRVIMEMMQLGNGAMYEQIAAMRTRIDNIVMGIDRVSIR